MRAWLARRRRRALVANLQATYSAASALAGEADRLEARIRAHDLEYGALTFPAGGRPVGMPAAMAAPYGTAPTPGPLYGLGKAAGAAWRWKWRLVVLALVGGVVYVAATGAVQYREFAGMPALQGVAK